MIEKKEFVDPSVPVFTQVAASDIKEKKNVLVMKRKKGDKVKA